MRRGSKKNRLLDYWAGIPALNLVAAFHRRRNRPAEPPKKIGVMCSPALGDTLLFSAALQDIRSAFHYAEIVHCCMGPNQGAAAIIPGADRRILIDLTRPDRSIQRLRPEHFDLFLDYTSWQRLTAFITMLSGARFTVGFKTPMMHRSRGYDQTVLHRSDRHEVDNFRALTASIGIPASHAPALSDLPATDLGAILPFALDRPLILLHLWPSGQRSWLREWPEERWLALALELSRHIPGAVFGITGTPGELPRTTPFVERMRDAGLEAQPVLCTFVELASLIERAALVVSVNTGVMHLAAIAGTPTVSINGPNSNTRWGPVGPHVFGVESPGSGCGYLHLGFDFDGQATDCMERIDVPTVLGAALSVLKGAAAHAGNA